MSVFSHDALINNANQFRTMLQKNAYSYSTLMYINPGENIGAETHNEKDQYLYILDGYGEAFLDNNVYDLAPGYFIIIPHGVYHDVKASFEKGMKILSIYAQDQHKN